MEQPQWHPGELLAVSGAYWKTCTLHAGVKLDVFTAIGGDTVAGETVARRLGTDPDGTTRLLNALTAMGLLEKSGSDFANTPAARTFLCKDAPKYLGYMILHHHYLVDSWARLDEAVRSGAPVRGRASFGDSAQREAFLMGMFNNAMLMAPGLVKTLDLAGRTRLLDLGGGPGTYAIHFCMENPELKATVFDLPTTRPFAEKTIQRFGMADRIDFQEGDFETQGVAGRYDVVWMSHILHGEGPEDCRGIIQKAVDASTPGGHDHHPRIYPRRRHGRPAVSGPVLPQHADGYPSGTRLFRGPVDGNAAGGRCDRHPPASLQRPHRVRDPDRDCPGLTRHGTMAFWGQGSIKVGSGTPGAGLVPALYQALCLPFIRPCACPFFRAVSGTRRGRPMCLPVGRPYKGMGCGSGLLQGQRPRPDPTRPDGFFPAMALDFSGGRVKVSSII